MGSFETGLYDENLENQRADFGLADVFGVSKAGDAIGTNGNAYYARIEDPTRKEPNIRLLQGFGDTNWLPGAQNRVPLSSRSKSAAHGGAGIYALPT